MSRIAPSLPLLFLLACAQDPSAPMPVPSAVALPVPQLRVRPAMPPKTPAPAVAGGHGWNDTQVQWLTFDVARTQAQRSHKPIFLVFYASWCPHCRTFSHVFEDPAVVAASRDFEMVRADSDANPDLSARFSPDGSYIPRTYFLSSDGELAANLQAHDGRYRYFYDENDPQALLAGMRRARETLR